LTRATDKLRDRFGFGKVQFGGSLRADGSKNESDEPRLSTLGRAHLKKSSES